MQIPKLSTDGLPLFSKEENIQIMDEYRVTSEWAELPHGSLFYTLPAVDLRAGSLALFGVGESPLRPEKVIIGRWFPDIAGYNWIMQPSRLIRVAKEAVIWVIGRIVSIHDSGLDWIAAAGMLVQGAYLVAINISDLLIPIMS